jgi:hypothetical protein
MSGDNGTPSVTCSRDSRSSYSASVLSFLGFSEVWSVTACFERMCVIWRTSGVGSLAEDSIASVPWGVSIVPESTFPTWEGFAYSLSVGLF